MFKSVVRIALAALIATAATSWLVAWGSTLADWSPVSFMSFWSVFNNLILFMTLVIISYYTFETNRLRAATDESNSLALRPIMTLLKSTPSDWTVENIGNGPALNVSIYEWHQKKLKITPLKKVVAIIKPNFQHVLPNGELTGVEDFKIAHPIARHLVEKIVAKESGLAIVYRDVSGRHHYSYYDASDHQAYAAFMEHGSLPYLSSAE